MTLTQPWWLLLVMLAALLVYFHRQRRAARAVEVGNVHLWRRLALHSSSRARPRARLSAALFLQGLVLLLVALALARPSASPPVGGGQVVILVEAGRAMRATDVRPNRFTAAVSAASGRLEGRSTVLLVADVPRPIAVARADPAALRRELTDEVTGTGASDGTPDWTAAARLIRALTGTQAQPPLIVYASPGERARAALALAEFRPAIRVIGGSEPNAAISALTVIPGRAGSPWQVAGRVHQYGAAGPRAVTIALGGTPLAERRLVLAPGGETAFSVHFTPGTGGVLSVRLDSADVLPADDVAQVVLRPTPAPLRVTVVGAAVPESVDDPIGRVLAALPGARVTRTTSIPLPGTADLLVVTGPSSGLPRHDLAPVSVWLTGPGTATRDDTVLGWAPGDPLGSGVAWADLGRQARATMPRWASATPLLVGADGPLLEVQRTQGHTAVRVAMSTTAGGWVDSPAFPVLFARLAALARPDTGQEVVPPCLVGLPCALAAGALDLRLPDGRVQPLVGESFIPWTAGVYRVDGQPLAVNRLAGAEADLQATGTAANVIEGNVGGDWLSRLNALWRPLLGLALLALLVELAVLIRSEPALRRRRWAALTRPQRRLLILHALSAALLLLAVLNVNLPGPAAPPLTVTVAPTPGQDLATALELAAARIPPGAHADLRVPDGAWPVSARLPDVLARLRARGHVFQTVGATTTPSLSITAFEMPSAVQPAQPFEAQILITARAAGTVRLRLRRGDVPLLDGPVTVRAGLNRLTLPLRETGPGLVGYTLSLERAGQPGVEAVAATAVGPPDPVLVIGKAGPARTALAQALRVQGLAVHPILPGDLGAADVQAATRTVLLDTPAAALAPPIRAALTNRVQAGGHLLIAGSAQAFGPGGYIGTSLETLSPMSGRVPRDLPRLALALVLDKSGSMNETVGGGLTKLDLIKSAALNSALLLSPQGDVTVIAFDSSPKVAVPLTRATNTALIRSQIGRIEAEGGTVVKRALDAALKELLKSSASRKHLILLTDGVDGGIFSPDEYRRLIRRMHATGITVSTVSVGSGMHVPLMRSMAEWGEGRFAQAQDWRDVPSLMARDTLSQGESAVKTGQFAAQWPGGPTFTLRQYVRTTLKPGATALGLVGTGATADPLAATWRVGLGSVTALALNPAASGSLGDRPEFPALLAPLVRGTPLDGGQALSAPTLRRAGADLLVTAPTARITLDGPDGPWPISLQPTADGRYVTRLYSPLPGGYSAPGAAVGLPTITRDLGSLGLMDAPGDAAATSGWAWTSAWPALALLALAAFLAGLALRYLPERPVQDATPARQSSPS
ncbi:VWA domain-containing protein [Deinococcus sp. KSM4-11]|uniref:VWA domain-containing protein n=1 Tax=Deinococcus sp. KSM4-11 TaxID=2568654 RepID=UPI0010A2BFAC|nr:VWA domain-containing protein [Deinococcus sp. KSM4-11]THF88625.1 VWA domain-containing protein [Deinococcus sp. KSM4-11]